MYLTSKDYTFDPKDPRTVGVGGRLVDKGKASPRMVSVGLQAARAKARGSNLETLKERAGKLLRTRSRPWPLVAPLFQVPPLLASPLIASTRMRSSSSVPTMLSRTSSGIHVLLLTLTSMQCRPAQEATNGPTAPVDAATAAPVVMVGPLERSEVQQRLPEWTSDAELDDEAVRGLASVTPGAEVTVIFGTWCSDSRRDVPRLWRAFDAAGALPFSVKFFGLDRAKTAPGFDKSGNDLQYVPTIVVKREGREVGRIVESTREPIERELWMLLQGKKNGLITARTDLGPSS